MIPTVSRYGLVNPIDGLIFYVGATIQPLSVRLNQHIYAAKNKNSYYGKEKGILIKKIYF